MEDLIQRFINFLEKDKRLSQNTLLSYRRDVEQYIEHLGNKEPEHLVHTNKNTVISYLLSLKELGKSASTVSRNLASIRSFYQYISRINIVEYDPTSDLESPKVERKLPQILSQAEVEILLEQPKCIDLKGYRDKAMLELLYATGIRVTELISLNIDDVDFERKSLRCSKGNKERIIPIGNMCLISMKEYISKSRCFLIRSDTEKSLFVNINGKRLTRQGFWKIIKLYKNQAKINKVLTPHTLRHSIAAHMIENGADMRSIQEILGHSDISSTQIYAQIAKNKANDSYQLLHPKI